MNLEDFVTDELYGERLLISIKADQNELKDNIRVARVLLNCFDDMVIRINEHLMTIGHKNPEYTINGKLGDFLVSLVAMKTLPKEHSMSVMWYTTARQL